MLVRALLFATAAATVSCGSGGDASLSASASPELNRAAAEANARLDTERARWQPLQRVDVLGRTFEAFRLGEDGPRFVWIPAPGAAVTVQTWVGHPVRTDGESIAQLEAAVRALRYASERPRRDVRARIGRDASRLNIRTIAAPQRWSAHVAFHADGLCRPQWSDQDLERALAHAVRLRGWAQIGARLTRAGWRARNQGGGPNRRVDDRSDTSADLRRLLTRWFTPADAVVVVAGPIERDDLLVEAADRFEACTVRRPKTRSPRRGPPRRRRSVRVPGPFRHALVSWALPKLSARDAAAIDGLVLWLADAERGPLAQALVPDHAMGVAVRHRDHPGGTDLEVLMTLAPSAATAAAVETTRTVFAGRFAGNDAAWVRARTGLRNRTMKRLSTLDGASALAARALLAGDTLGHLARRLEASTRLSSEDVRRIASRYLLSEAPLVIQGHPRSRR